MLFRLSAVLVILLISACSGDNGDGDGEPSATPTATATATASPTQASTPTATATPEPVVDEPGEPGPFSAGVTTIEYNRTSTSTGQPRLVEAVIWYPTEQAGPEDEFLSGVKDAPIAGDQLLPLIVFSHGSGGNTLQSTFLTTHLASHGFVVASVSHTGNTTADCFPCTDRAELEDSYRNRPDDVAFVRDQLLGNGDQSPGVFGGRLDPQRVGITGHSFGGFTTVAALARGGWDAGAALAPVDIVLPGATLADIEAPLLVFGGRLDDVTPFAMQENIIEGASNAAASFLVELPHAGHLNFSDFCVLQLPGCRDQDIDNDLAHDLVNRYVTAFFRAYLNGENAYVEYLLPGNEPDPEVIVQQASGVGDDPEQTTAR